MIQGTFQTLVAIADQHFGGDLKGRILLTAGMGGMGGNQPRAITMLGGVCICADVDIEVVRRRQRIGYCDVVVEDFDEALRLAREAARARQPLGIALVGNAIETLRRASQLNWKPDIITDMTPAHDPLAYVPDGLTVAEARALRRSDRADYLKRTGASMIEHLTLMNRYLDQGVQVFEYGNHCVRKRAMPVCPSLRR